MTTAVSSFRAPTTTTTLDYQLTKPSKSHAGLMTSPGSVEPNPSALPRGVSRLFLAKSDTGCDSDEPSVFSRTPMSGGTETTEREALSTRQFGSMERKLA